MKDDEVLSVTFLVIYFAGNMESISVIQKQGHVYDQ